LFSFIVGVVLKRVFTVYDYAKKYIEPLHLIVHPKLEIYTRVSKRSRDVDKICNRNTIETPWEKDVFKEIMQIMIFCIYLSNSHSCIHVYVYWLSW